MGCRADGVPAVSGQPGEAVSADTLQAIRERIPCTCGSSRGTGTFNIAHSQRCPRSLGVIEFKAVIRAAAEVIHRETAARFYRDVRQAAEDYTDHERDVIAWIPFCASLDQLAAESYGLTDKEMGDV